MGVTGVTKLRFYLAPMSSLPPKKTDISDTSRRAILERRSMSATVTGAISKGALQ
jgi:hypothetical protein